MNKDAPFQVIRHDWGHDHTSGNFHKVNSTWRNYSMQIKFEGYPRKYNNE